MILHAITLLILGLLTALRLPSLLKHRDPVLTVAVLMTGVTLLEWPGNIPQLDGLLGVHGAGVLLDGLFTMAAFGKMRVAMVHAVVDDVEQEAHIQRARTATMISVTVYATAFFCMFLVGPGHGRGYSVTALLANLAERSDVGGFICGTVLNAFVAMTAYSILKTFLQHLPGMGSRAFRLGFGGVVVGCVFRIGSQLSQEVRGFLIMIGLPDLAAKPLDWVSVEFAGISGLLIAFGLTLPVLGRRSPQLGILHRMMILLIFPVWFRAVSKYPDVVVTRKPTLMRGVVSRIPRGYLHRAIVEVNDCDFMSREQLLSLRERAIIRKAEEVLYA